VDPDFHLVVSEEDRDRVEALARDIWTAHYVPIVGREQIEYMLGRMQSAGAIAAQIREGMRYWTFGPVEAPVGYIAWKVEPDHVFLSKLYVAKPHRGQGWSRRALDHLLSLESPARVRLTVNRHNTGSIRAYQALGFQTTGTQVADIGGGFVMDDFVMEWRGGVAAPRGGR
jgi:ribosomal protein S18 acetylase RimI-like enzyme